LFNHSWLKLYKYDFVNSVSMHIFYIWHGTIIMSSSEYRLKEIISFYTNARSREGNTV
jgi:hypothetical protein